MFGKNALKILRHGRDQTLARDLQSQNMKKLTCVFASEIPGGAEARNDSCPRPCFCPCPRLLFFCFALALGLAFSLFPSLALFLKICSCPYLSLLFWCCASPRLSLGLCCFPPLFEALPLFFFVLGSCWVSSAFRLCSAALRFPLLGSFGSLAIFAAKASNGNPSFR